MKNLFKTNKTFLVIVFLSSCVRSTINTNQVNLSSMLIEEVDSVSLARLNSKVFGTHYTENGLYIVYFQDTVTNKMIMRKKKSR